MCSLCVLKSLSGNATFVVWTKRNATFVAILILAFLTSAKKVKCFCLAVNLKVHPFPHLSQVSHLEHIQDVCDEDILVEHVEGEDQLIPIPRNSNIVFIFSDRLPPLLS